jgi:hypothetical protein
MTIAEDMGVWLRETTGGTTISTKARCLFNQALVESRPGCRTLGFVWTAGVGYLDQVLIKVRER